MLANSEEPPFMKACLLPPPKPGFVPLTGGTHPKTLVNFPDSGIYFLALTFLCGNKSERGRQEMAAHGGQGHSREWAGKS